MLLLLLGAAVYLPGLWSIPPVDRDEARFAQASRQMFESVALPHAQRDAALHGGGVVVPMLGQRPRLNKPPVIYWLQAGSAWVATGGRPERDAIWMYRVPSVVGAVVAVSAVWVMGRRLMGPAGAWLGAAMLAACPVVVWEAHQARADLVLLAFTTAAMAALHRVWRAEGPARGWAAPVAFWVAMAGGILTKGPITPMVAGLTVLTLCVVSRRWRWVGGLRPCLGVVVVAALVGPWVVGVVRSVGWEVYWTEVMGETLGRSMTTREGHWGLPGYHAVLSAALFWPGSLLALAAVVHAWHRAGVLEPGVRGGLRALPGRWKRRADGDPDALFLIAWLVPAWIVFEAVMTKLPHYTMPLYPALALVTALAIDRMLAGRAGAIEARSQRVGAVVWGAIGLALLAGVSIGLAMLVTGFTRGAAIGSAVVGGGLAVAAVVVYFRGRVVAAHVLGLAGVAVFAVATLGMVLPSAQRVWVSPRVMHALGGHTGPVAALGYHEDSLVFLTRGRLEKVGSAEGARRWLVAHPGGLLVAPAHEADTLGGEVLGSRIEGFNYSNGRSVDLRIVRPWRPSPDTPSP